MVLTASYVDSYVGLRMRQRREALGISQGRLGRHLGLTFSQIQKYEKGSNRIGAGRLYQISQYLNVSPMYFFEGLELEGAAKPAGSTPRGEGQDFELLREAFRAIEDPETRRSVLALVRSLGDAGPPSPRTRQ